MPVQPPALVARSVTTTSSCSIAGAGSAERPTRVPVHSMSTIATNARHLGTASGDQDCARERLSRAGQLLVVSAWNCCGVK